MTKKANRERAIESMIGILKGFEANVFYIPDDNSKTFNTQLIFSQYCDDKILFI